MIPLHQFNPHWLYWPEVQRFLDIFAPWHGEICFIGGCVRDSLAELQPGNIDVVTAMETSAVLHTLESAGVQSRLALAYYGWSTATIGEVTFNIHSLHSALNYTLYNPSEPFSYSAARFVANHDFTLNTLFCDAEGRLYDQFGGGDDLIHGRIRPTSDPTERFRKRPGEILRYFRFFASFGAGEPDPAVLEACVQHKERLEAIQPWLRARAINGLLGAARPYAMLRLMQELDILDTALGFKVQYLEPLAKLERIEQAINRQAPFQVRLALLMLHSDHSYYDTWRKVLKTGGQPEFMPFWVRQVGKYIHTIKTLSEEGIEHTISEIGAKAYNDILLTRWAME